MKKKTELILIEAIKIVMVLVLISIIFAIISTNVKILDKGEEYIEPYVYDYVCKVDNKHEAYNLITEDSVVNLIERIQKEQLSKPNITISSIGQHY